MYNHKSICHIYTILYVWRTYFPQICLVFRLSDKAEYGKSKFLTDGTNLTRWRGLVLYKAAVSVRIPCLPLIRTAKTSTTKGKIKVDRMLFWRTVDPDEMPHRMRHFIWILTACQRQCNTQKLKPSCENCDCCLPECERISSDPNFSGKNL